jgi:ATP-dependent RNA helicase DeaD
MDFKDLNINPKIIQAITEANYTDVTEIQANTIPQTLLKRDILAQAPTGTGKTAAFVIPALAAIDVADKKLQVLVICPTRELVNQIVSEFVKLGKYLTGLKALAIYGGESVRRQISSLDNHPQIIAATTGRLHDLIKQRYIDLSTVKLIVLDEADVMFDMGFLNDVKKIFTMLPAQKQSLFFSATFPQAIMEISKKYQTNPFTYTVKLDKENLPMIKQHYVEVRENNKIKFIAKLIKEKDYKLVIIFSNTK